MTWTSPGRCSTCKFCRMDMDLEPWCEHPAVMRENPIGLHLNCAINLYCGADLKLREPIE